MLACDKGKLFAVQVRGDYFICHSNGFGPACPERTRAIDEGG